MRFNVKALALTSGLIWGIGLFVLTWWIILFEGASAEPNFIAKAYRGYSFSPVGSIIGLAWAFVDGVIGGALFGALYNWLSERGREHGG